MQGLPPLLISSCLMASFSPSLRSNTRFSAASALELFESDKTFRDSHMVMTGILRLSRSRIRTYNLIDCGASGFSFIDEKFAHTNQIPLHLLKYPRRLEGFDGQRALSGNITHVAEITMDLEGHVEKLFLYVTGLKNYPIILGHPWLRRHNAIADFGHNTLTFASPYCLTHCCPHPVKLQAVEEEFLTPAESRKIWDEEILEDALGKVINQDTSIRTSITSLEEGEEIPTIKNSIPDNPVKIEESIPLFKTAQRDFTLIKPEINEPEPQPQNPTDEPSRIENAIQQGLPPPKIRYRSPSKLRTSTQRRAHQAARKTTPQMNVCEIGAISFNRLTRKKNHDSFALSMKEIDLFLGKTNPEPLVMKASPSSAPDLIEKAKKPSPAYQPLPSGASPHEKEIHLALFKMNKALTLATAVTREELDAYRESKNVDPAPLLPKQYHEFLDVFSKKKSEDLPPRRPYDHAINLKEGTQAPSQALYGMSRTEIEELRRYLDENLAKGFIRASRSHAASPVMFVKKPGGGLRFCVDYRALNAITIKDRYPLPLIAETLHQLIKAKIFTKIDIIAAFNMLRIREGDEELTAFRTRFGLFESLVLPFGLCNGPASFQHFINDTLHEYLADFCTAYLDDILIYSDNELEHEVHVKKILSRLRDAGLQADITKCKFHVTEIAYLGMIVTTEGIKMDPAKVETVVNWPNLVNVKDVQSFLGFANFYRRFVYGFSDIAGPLTNLTKKETEFLWTDKCQLAFEMLKKAFTSDVILRHFDPDRPIIVETDASDYVSGGILSQYDDDGILHPVAYFSKKHNPAECNYEIYDKELMAIVRCFEEWRPELEGSAFPISVISDHKNLEYFASTKQLSRRQARWSEFLSRFDFKIVYRPGKAGGKPDALTRRSGDLPKEGDDTDERRKFQHQTILKTENLDEEVAKSYLRSILLAPAFLDDADIEEAEPQLDEDLIDPDEDISTELLWEQALTRDQFAPEVLEALRNNERHHNRIQLAECEDRDGILYFRNKKYVPRSDRLRLRIIQLAHDSVAGGHPGRSKCHEVVNRSYWWPSMHQSIKRFIRNCHTCRRSKPSRQRYQGWLRPLPPPERRWRDISMDYVGPLTPSTFMGITYRYILVVIDRLSKMRHFIPITSMEVEDAADAFYQNVWKLHGLPEAMVSDRGPQFVSDFWQLMCKRLKIDAKLSTGYHPETDGQTERANATMEHYLRAYVNYMQDDWAQWLPGAEFASNNTDSSSILASPFLANFGQHPRMGFEPEEPLPQDLTAQGRANLVAANQFVNKMQDIDTHLRDEMLMAQASYEATANANRRPCPRYFVGDMVWLSTRNIQTARPTVKLDDRNIGPYRVSKVFSNPLIVQLELPDTVKIHPVFHVNLLQHDANDPLPGQRPEPRDPVIAEDGQREWYVNRVLNSKLDRRFQPPLLKYLVDWEGHPSTWEPFNYLINCQQVIDEYHQAYPNAAGPHLNPCQIPRCQCHEA